MTIKNAENEWQMHQQRSNVYQKPHKQETAMTKFYLNDERDSTSTLADTEKTNYYEDSMLDDHTTTNNNNNNNNTNNHNDNLNSVNASIDFNQTTDSSLNNIIETLNAIEKSNQHDSLADRNSSKNLIYQSFLSANNNQMNADEQTTTNNKINTRLKIVAMRNTPTPSVMRGPLLSDRHANVVNHNSASSSSSSIQSNTNEANENDKAREMSMSQLAQLTQNSRNAKSFYHNANANNNEEQQELLSSSSNNLRPTTQISNSRPSSAASYQRQPLINIKSNTSLLAATNTQTNANLNSLIANTISPSNQAAIKRSMAYNNGANIHEETSMFFYGNRSLDIIDMRLDSSVLNQVYTLSFHYIDYDLFLSRNFARIRNKFFNANVSHSFFV